MAPSLRALCAAVTAASWMGASAHTHSLPTAWPTQEPFWPHYPSRNVQTLTGEWEFGMAPAGTDPTSVQYANCATPNTTMVPGSFDVAPPGVLGPRGTVFFRSSHTCTPGRISLLKFYAVNFYARVFVDGVDIGNSTIGGYTPFEMVSPPCASTGQRELLVVVNNEPNATLSPTFTGGDFYFYSGIIRPVVVTELPQSSSGYWLDRVEPHSIDYTKGLINIRVFFAGNLTSAKGSVHLAYAFNGAALGNAQQYPLVNGSAIIPSVAVPDFKLWTPGQNNANNLYTLQVQEPFANDSIITRSAIRVIGIDTASARITINGHIVSLHGFNRHTMWPDVGAAVTPAQEQADMQLLLSLNANYVRGAHYPQSQSWLDLCDENGIVMWEETLGPGTS